MNTSDTFLKNVCSGLSVSQVLALFHISKGENVLVTGSPGSGKSHMTWAIQKYLFYKKKPFLITSSTASSGNVIDAPTMHSQTGLGIGDLPFATYLEKMKPYGMLNKLTLYECIIIDEISMIKPSYFELFDRLLR